MKKANLENQNAHQQFSGRRIDHWNNIGVNYSKYKKTATYYHRYLTKIYKQLIPQNLKILELGCGHGDLLNSLKPSQGVGVDFSKEMITQGKILNPDVEFIQQDAHEITLDKTFDIIIISDLLNDLWDVQEVFQNIKKVSNQHTRIIINFYSQLWEKPLKLAEKIGFSRPKLGQNWLSFDDIKNLLLLEDLEITRHWTEFICPFQIPVIAPLFNRFLAKLWPFCRLTLTTFLVIRPQPVRTADKRKSFVSVIVPARNEAGNIEEIFQRIPEMGSGTEIIFVEGGSKDNTYETIEKVIAAHPERKAAVMRQSGEGKGDAVRIGFSSAKGDIFMILDADMTVVPEDLTRFYEALVSGKGDFINGVRLVYPMEGEAMRYFNLIGNKFFSYAFSWLLGQPIKDSLCGTKVLSKRNYELIASNRNYFGEFDPFGDFDLLFGAAKQNLKIVDLPIRYRKRKYGDTNISRWKHGILLLKMVLFAAKRIKFV
jgi:SAM-dependent methyltransferase